MSVRGRGVFSLALPLVVLATAAVAAPQAKPAPAPAAKAAPAPAQAAAPAKVCTPPVAPPSAERPVRPPLPEKPACIDAKDGCPGLEAYRYNDAVKAYNLQAQAFRPVAEAYFQKLSDYVKAASAYAQCEAEALQK
ncbi:hypothetical protein QO012_000983 [Methylobacterium aerolatum]|uniref:Uncharacterized protein n=1 Tax=Methylobacterium aerolatum TaxID=418708 RepID=A0ABU0HVX9_9HYPH|nr:hypothetical protein [Methylobacterium aerolatum]MDQ0446494.1 hypothetical protein [Methylobacterium aerolatum]